VKVRVLFAACALLVPSIAGAELKLANIFSDHMVVQQKMPVKVWGWTKPGQEVTVTLADKSATAKAGDDGRFDASLPAVDAGGPYTLEVKADETRTINDVLVGEVWICSGQSNMQWNVGSSTDADLERLAAKHPKIRMINFPQIGTQEPVLTHDDRKWMECTPDTVSGFSAVGYFFGRQLHDTIDVPIGMINNAWGGSACEAWINRDVLNADPQYAPMMERWAGRGESIQRTFNEGRLERRRQEDAAEPERSHGRKCPPCKHLQWRIEVSSGLHDSRRDLVSG
jgi:sialate O-acetylesterase